LLWNNLLLILAVLTFGLQMGSFFLGLFFYLSRRELWKFKGILFLGYLVLLYFFAMLRFYLHHLLNMEGSLTFLVINALEMTGISLLIYYFSATINYFMKRKWRKLQLTWVLIAVVATFSLGVARLVFGYSPVLHLILSLFLIISMTIIFINALRSLPLIQRPIDRISVTFLSGLTLIFLPLILTSRFLGVYLEDTSIGDTLSFTVSSCYYLGLAIILIRYFIRRSLERDDRIVSLSEQPRSFFEDISVTPRERDIILLLEKGFSYKEIGADLDISINTVNNHIANIYKKFSVRSKVELLNALRDNRLSKES